jgi:hypothetical protein
MTPSPDFREDLLQILKDQNRDALALLATATTPKMRQAILDEAEKILARMDEAQNLRLVKVTGNLLAALDELKAADVRLKEELQGVADVATLIDKVSGFLAVVDQVIDLARGRA